MAVAAEAGSGSSVAADGAEHVDKKRGRESESGSAAARSWSGKQCKYVMLPKLQSVTSLRRSLAVQEKMCGFNNHVKSRLNVSFALKQKQSPKQEPKLNH